MIKLERNVFVSHYENTPMQYIAIFHGCENDNFQLNFFYYFHIFAQNMYCWVHVRTASMRTP